MYNCPNTENIGSILTRYFSILGQLYTVQLIMCGLLNGFCIEILLFYYIQWMKTGFGGHYLRTFCTRFKLSRIGQWPVHKHKRFTRVIVKQETKQKRNETSRNETKQDKAETKRTETRHNRNETEPKKSSISIICFLFTRSRLCCFFQKTFQDYQVNP